MSTFITPPDGTIGNPINIDNVLSFSYTPYKESETFDNRRFYRALHRYTMELESSAVVLQAPQEKDYTHKHVVYPSITFETEKKKYTWTAREDNELLKTVYDKLITNTYFLKGI